MMMMMMMVGGGGGGGGGSVTNTHTHACIHCNVLHAVAFGSAQHTHFAQEGDGDLFIDALYFSISSLTTVGYGDRVGKSVAVKVFSLGWLAKGTLSLGRMRSGCDRVQAASARGAPAREAAAAQVRLCAQQERAGHGR